MIIQSINLLDQLDKDVNLFCMRMKEWFSYHFPELRKVVPDNIDYVKVVGLIGTREGATEDKLEELEALTNAETAQAIVTTAKSSFGMYGIHLPNLFTPQVSTSPRKTQKVLVPSPIR